MSSFLVLTAVVTVLVSSFYFLYHLLLLVLGKGCSGSKNLPNGSTGLPFIGENLSFLKAQKDNRGEEWVDERISKHGPVFKTSLMGAPTVFLTGHAGTKFILGADPLILAPRQPKTITAVLGKNTLVELTGARYKIVKEAMVSFLKPESLQNHVRHMDGLIEAYITRETKDRQVINTVSFMRKLTFHIACRILFGIHDQRIEDSLFEDFRLAFEAMWSVPLNIPGTTYWRGVRARGRIIATILPIMNTRKEQLLKGTLNPRNDVLTCLLALRDEDQKPLTDDLVIDNFISLMVASHDTTAVVLSLLVQKLAKDPKLVYPKFLQEQMSVVSSDEREGNKQQVMTWSDIQKMKYSWRVVQELMRLIPPFFGSFRTAVQDTKFGGYDIHKGWQVFWISYPTHMNKDIFADPDAFDPSRFENPSKPIPPYAYVPFGGGPHGCIGNEFARVEILTVIHHLVTKFELWTLVNPDEKISRLALPFPSMGLPIILKPRK